MTSSFFVITVFVLILAWANGANDISKGVATLVGNGTTNARRAVLWGTFWTVMGGLAALIWGTALLTTFSSAYLSQDFHVDLAFVAGTTTGAALWVMLATRLGLPVSTTHALLGGVVGAALMAAGPVGLQAHAVANKALLPLLASPLIAVFLCAALLLVARQVAQWSSARNTNAFIQAKLKGSPRIPKEKVWIALHWLSSGVTSFARGLNDVPKIAAFLIMATMLAPELSGHLEASRVGWSIVLVTLVMGVGCLWGGYRVLQLLAHRVTPLDAGTGLAANIGTALLVLTASPLGIPVSTTHVSTGALLGVRWMEGTKPKQADALKLILFGWVITLPIAALLAAITTALFHVA